MVTKKSLPHWAWKVNNRHRVQFCGERRRILSRFLLSFCVCWGRKKNKLRIAPLTKPLPTAQRNRVKETKPQRRWNEITKKCFSYIHGEELSCLRMPDRVSFAIRLAFPILHNVLPRSGFSLPTLHHEPAYDSHARMHGFFPWEVHNHHKCHLGLNSIPKLQGHHKIGKWVGLFLAVVWPWDN